ncbi:MAG: hypothetical protein JWN67_3674 [Actinomycetia bacterium]|nr:hypothetical protein [Actinomycetes bacterium]
MSRSATISQADNFAGRFGLVFRSSAVFYVANDDAVTTTLSFMDYWKLKRGLDVAVVASTRDMAGNLVDRERLTWAPGQVVNHRTAVAEGSVEIEVFCNEELVIPYAAVMGVYETASGIAMVHSYARSYSPHEIEEGRAITRGEEACWTLRDSPTMRSFCVVHNGGQVQPAQQVRLEVTDQRGRTRGADIQLAALAPYETVRLVPSEHVTDLVGLLDGGRGDGRLSFDLTGAFTRMLVGVESVDRSDLQVTHSNFNYSRHATDLADDDCAWMDVPRPPGRSQQVVVYPDAHAGVYEVDASDGRRTFSPGERLEVPADRTLAFRRLDGKMPTRIVTGVVTENDGIPHELSLGVSTRRKPSKRLAWGLADESTSLYAHDLPVIFGGATDDPMVITLHGTTSSSTSVELPAWILRDLGAGLPLVELLPDAAEVLGGDFGWWTARCDYGGLSWYSSLERPSGSLAVEHGF